VKIDNAVQLNESLEQFEKELPLLFRPEFKRRKGDLKQWQAILSADLGKLSGEAANDFATLVTDLLRYEAQLTLRMRGLAIDAERQG